ncbi:MAG: hypothetical protein IJQ53_02475 [Clostridia bacterium]|nr:hypothetical protein [Clostridia bacterium]
MTGQQLLQSALDLCALRETDGTIPADSADMTQRAPALINVLLAENAWLDARVSKTALAVHTISALSDTLNVHPLIASGVLPYGLARLLLTGEDDASAARFGELYEAARAETLRSGRAAAGSVTEVYE